MTVNADFFLKNETTFTNTFETVQKFNPDIDPELIQKALSFIRDDNDRFGYTNVKFEDQVLPFPITRTENDHYLLHLKNVDKPRKGSFKVCYPIIELDSEQNKVKRRAELLINKMSEFEARFPHCRKEFDSKQVMHAPLYEVYDHGDRCSFIYPYYEHTIASYFKEKKLSAREKVNIVLDFALGVQDIHEQGFVHRDLKEVNGMVKLDKYGQLKVKVGDLDSVIEESKTTLTDFFGTIGYVPYERPTYKSDVYSLGRILTNAFNLVPVVYMSENRQVSDFEKQIVDLALLCKVKDPDQRIGLDEFIVRLNGISMASCTVV